MLKIKLYIEDQEIELTEDVTFAITKQFEDLTNPTTIINEWSKTVSIPFSVHNNKVFGNIYRPDMLTIYSSSIGYGVNFDPYKKLDFKLLYNNEVIMNGYAKMNSITKSNGKGTYDITLNGLLGKLFYEMQKITFDLTSDLTDYIIDASCYVDEYIDKDLVHDCWNSDGQTNEKLYEKYLYAINPSTGEVIKTINHNWHLNDIIGFAPNNSFDDNFDYKVFQRKSGDSYEFQTSLEDSSFYEATGINADTAVGDGLLPRAIGEYRSYQLLPFIYFNKLFQIFQKKAEDITGYAFDLDSTWFNEDNPYWHDLVFMLNKLNDDKASQKANQYVYRTTSGTTIGDWTLNTTYTSTRNTSLYASAINTENVSIYTQPTSASTGKSPTSFNGVNQYVEILPEVSNETFHFTIPVYLADYAGSAGDDTNIKKDNGLFVEVLMDTGTADGYYDINPSLGTYSNKFLLVASDTTLNQSDYPEWQFITIPAALKPSSSGIEYTTLDAYFTATHKINGDRAKFRMTSTWLLNEYPIRSTSGKGEISLISAPSGKVLMDAVVNSDSKRSNSAFTLNDLWNNDYNLFTQILNYCKIYRIIVNVDDYSKKITFIQANNYFKDYTIEDWTNKVDFGSDFTVVPITFENKYIIFNYDDNDNYLVEAYNDKYGFKPGEYRLITNYNFNEDSEDLFSGVKGSLNSTDNVLSWTNLYNNKQIVYSLPNETLVVCFDEDHKYVDVFGQYFFFTGKKAFCTEEKLYMRDVKISDDTPLQQSTNTFFYSQDANYVDTEYYTSLRTHLIKDGKNYLCLFNKPMLSYTYDDEYTDGISIYQYIWKGFIEERYNITNKKITCYINIKPTDYINFTFKKFINVDNQLYFINKIYDYDITSNGLTKVDLVQISDASAYAADLS